MQLPVQPRAAKSLPSPDSFLSSAYETSPPQVSCPWATNINQETEFMAQLFIRFLQSTFIFVIKGFVFFYFYRIARYILFQPANIFYLGPNKKLNRVNVCQVKFGQMLFQQQPDESFLGMSRCHFGCHEFQCCSYSTSFDKTLEKVLICNQVATSTLL